MVASLFLNNSEDFFDYHAGQVIYAQDDDPAFLYILMSGKVRIVKEQDNRIIPVVMLNEKDVFGEIEILLDERRQTSAIAYSDVEVIKIKKGDMARVLFLCPEWVRHMVKILSERLGHTHKLIADHKIYNEDFQGEALQPEEEVKIKRALARFR